MARKSKWTSPTPEAITAGELIDFLGVSSPSILDMAEYTDEEGDALFIISDSLTEDDIRLSGDDIHQGVLLDVDGG